MAASQTIALVVALDVMHVPGWEGRLVCGACVTVYRSIVLYGYGFERTVAPRPRPECGETAITLGYGALLVRRHAIQCSVTKD